MRDANFVLNFRPVRMLSLIMAVCRLPAHSGGSRNGYGDNNKERNRERATKRFAKPPHWLKRATVTAIAAALVALCGHPVGSFWLFAASSMQYGG